MKYQKSNSVFKNNYFYTNSISSCGNTTNKNVGKVPYIDLFRWGIFFFREPAPFKNGEYGLANRPTNFLGDAKTCTGEHHFQYDYFNFFCISVDKEEPLNCPFIVEDGELTSPRILREENIDRQKIIKEHLPSNLNIFEKGYINKKFKNYHFTNLF